MLQHNARRAHVAHAAVVGLHAICCGVPALAMLATLAGAATSAALLSDSFGQFHELLHRHEGWLLGLSGLLVLIGAVLEAQSRRARPNTGFPWLFAVSVVCFLANLAIIIAHRG